MAAVSREPSLFEDEFTRALPATIGNACVIASDSRHILNPGKGSTKSFDFTLNAYRGCSFDCAYCYAPSFVADVQMRESWGTWVEVKEAAAEVIRRTKLEGKTVFMSSVTDPYQPLEAKTKLTRDVVSELLKAKARLVVQTRSPLVARDIDLLRQFEYARVNMSITTDDDEMRRKFEPMCASIQRRLDTVRELSDAGIRTGICICPMLPLRDPKEFAERIRNTRPTRITACFLEFSGRAFSSNTRDRGREMTIEIGWTRDRYKETLSELKAQLPEMTVYGEGYAPE